MIHYFVYEIPKLLGSFLILVERRSGGLSITPGPVTSGCKAAESPLACIVDIRPGGRLALGSVGGGLVFVAAGVTASLPAAAAAVVAKPLAGLLGVWLVVVAAGATASLPVAVVGKSLAGPLGGTTVAPESTVTPVGATAPGCPGLRLS